jgi:hypothetical protein
LAVIEVLVEQYATLPNPDYSNVCFGLQYLNRPLEVAKTLDELCRGSLDGALQAYQIAFDLQEAENQGFVLKIVAGFDEINRSSSSSLPPVATPVEGIEVLPLLISHYYRKPLLYRIQLPGLPMTVRAQDYRVLWTLIQ